MRNLQPGRRHRSRRVIPRHAEMSLLILRVVMIREPAVRSRRKSGDGQRHWITGIFALIRADPINHEFRQIGGVGGVTVVGPRTIACCAVFVAGAPVHVGVMVMFVPKAL